MLRVPEFIQLYELLCHSTLFRKQMRSKKQNSSVSVSAVCMSFQNVDSLNVKGRCNNDNKYGSNVLNHSVTQV